VHLFGVWVEAFRRADPSSKGGEREWEREKEEGEKSTLLKLMVLKVNYGAYAVILSSQAVQKHLTKRATVDSLDISHRPVLFKYDVSETELCVPPQVEAQLGPIDSASSYLRRLGLELGLGNFFQ
jgi:hypothetical protein